MAAVDHVYMFEGVPLVVITATFTKAELAALKDHPDLVKVEVTITPVAAIEGTCAGGRCPDPDAHAEGAHDV